MADPTPGPWMLETVKTSIGVCHRIGPFPGSCGHDVGSACVYEDGMHLQGHIDTELLANARLIAAAPDLLDAAKHAAMEWRLHGQLTDSCRVLEAAIAKAEGR